jgi:hypothetical protein
MTKLLMAFLVTVTSCLAMAGEVRPAAPAQKGINEQVTIKYMRTNWAYTYRLGGFYVGEARVDVVPVTREAAKVLQDLNKTSTYNCVIENSTFVPQYQESEVVGGTYFVLDMNCK